jgi:FtsH-binding integral membrane protein
MDKILFTLFLINFVFAQSLGFPSQNLPPVINCGQDFFQCLGFFFAKILRVIIALALVLSTIFIAWAGILYITKGGGKEEDIKKIHQMLLWAGVGLVVAFLAFAFVKLLEIWISRGQVYFPNFVYAQIEEPRAPTSLKCGPVSLPSALEGGSLSQDVWKACFLFYAQRILSFLYVLALMLGVIFLSWAGILYITKPEKSKDIHQRLIFGIVGIIIAILSFTIVKIIDLFFTKL